jgi:YYY domain-containing protein
MLDVTANTRPVEHRVSFSRSDWFIAALLVVIIIFGGYFRFVGLNWDDFTHLHPDERFLTGVASALGGGLRSSESGPVEQQAQIDECVARYPQTGGQGSFFDAQCSTWNPHNTGNGMYVYGTLPLFIARWTGDLVNQLTVDPSNALQNWSGYNGVHLVWRTISALSEMGTIFVVFFIGVTIHDKWIGILAAALYAAVVLSIQLSHFATVDAMASFFTALVILFAARVQVGGGLGSYAGFGFALAAALATRINLAPLVGLVILAAMVRALPALDSKIPWRERESLIFNALLGLVVAGVISIVCFRLFNPYTFMGPGFFGLSINERWTKDLSQASYLVSGAAEMPPNWQWAGRTPYLFPLSNIVLWGTGIALGLTAILGWFWSGYRLVFGKLGAIRNILLFVWILVYFGWLGRNWVSTMRYFLPIYPVMALLAAWVLVELVRRARNAPVRRTLAVAFMSGVVLFTYLWAMMFTNIYRHQLTRVQASHWVWENVPGDFSMRIDGTDAPLINFAVPNGYASDPNSTLVSQASGYFDGQTFTSAFTPSASGTITSVYAPHLGDPADDTQPESIRVSVKSNTSGDILGQGTLTADFKRDNHVLGDAYTIPLDAPVNVVDGETYIFTVEALSGGPIISGGSVVSHEGAWDDAIPYSVCTLPPGVTLADDPPPGLLDASNCNGRNAWSGLISGYEMQLAYEDEEYKRGLMLQALDDSDYLTISSNRFYDSEARIPIRWPMTLHYYDALFKGELGYELVETFQETFELGPLRISDQYLPTYSSPKWLNEFEAEEAFHVYDHPVVFIFRKSADYDSEKVHAILNSVPMNRADIAGTGFVESCPSVFLRPGGGGCDTAIIDTAPISALQSAAMPTQLMLSPDRQEIQSSNGTWSNRFDSSSLINANPVVTVAGWWLTIIVFGWVAWPLLFALFPSFADRGYGFAKLVGVLLSGWLAWYASSVGIAAWSRNGIMVTMLLLLLLSIAMIARRPGEYVTYLRQHWRRLIAIEMIALVAFLGFLAVRLTNPDLWHPSFGGEKPMDFAYFNGVLRSTIFPAIDPWYAGGYINYYYFGYIIVGTPVLLLGVMPSIAYNLILPTLFALTGIGAFTVAFNLVSHWRERRKNFEDDEPQSQRLGNPWVAGIAALLLAVVLGNLDTPRVFGTGVAQLGGYQQPEGLDKYLIAQYQTQYGVPPNEAAMFDIMSRVNSNNLADRIAYEVNNSTTLVSSLVNGFGRVLAGEQLPIAANRWYWAPTRVISEVPGDGSNAINEMPFFTFLYGDLHAHMISMPMMLLVMGFLLNELLLARRDHRSSIARWLALALGALTVGLLRGVNTWDWPTFMLLSVIGLAFAWWLNWQIFSRRSLANFAGRIGGFVVLSIALSLPYITWYAATYGRVLPWQGNRTPLWAYFDIHGLFLFLIFSLLVWETVRWLRSVYVRSLRGLWPLFVSIFVAGIAVMIGLFFLATASYQVAVVAIPLLIWIAVLFFRPGQSREMQFVFALAGLALALTLGVEFVVLDGDIGRQNTVFKFYIQAWMLFSVVGGAAFAWLFHNSIFWSGRLRNTWYVIAAVLFAAAALYPIMASRGKAVDRMAPETPFTLDGMEYMKYATQFENDANIPLIDDYNMIRWLQENVQGTPVIIEAQSWREYLWSGRVAIYTGMPGVLGWRFHQTQQRTFEPLSLMVNQRRANINAFYTTPDIPTTQRMIDSFGIQLIIVAGLEKAYYPPEGLEKFDLMVDQGLLEKIYEQGDAEVYRVIPQPVSVAMQSVNQGG